MSTAHPASSVFPSTWRRRVLNGDLADDAIAIHRNPNRYLVASPRPERIIDELPRPAWRGLVLRARPVRIFDEFCNRRPVGARGLSHDDVYRDLLKLSNVRFSAEAWIIQPYAPRAFR